MRVEILSDQPVSPNYLQHNRSVACAYPSSTTLTNRGVACVYRQGTSKHSPDGVLLMQTSPDGGACWSEPQVVFDGRHLNPAKTVESGGICSTRNGTLLATFGVVEGLAAGVYVFSEQGMALRRETCVTRSEDGGASWAGTRCLDVTAFRNAGITAKPFVVSNTQICVPVEVQTDRGPMGTALTFSQDDGRSFESLAVCAADSTGRLNLCDARFTTLRNGHILMLLWTFLQENEKTIEVHQSVSSDGGRTWPTPQPTAISGQIAAPLWLSSGVLIVASNYRHTPEGIRLWMSFDEGRRWDSEPPIQMWDLRKSCVLGTPAPAKGFAAKDENVWEALDRFTFGTPDLLELEDGSILLTYYGTIDGITHVRACRFRLL